MFFHVLRYHEFTYTRVQNGDGLLGSGSKLDISQDGGNRGARTPQWAR